MQALQADGAPTLRGGGAQGDWQAPAHLVPHAERDPCARGLEEARTSWKSLPANVERLPCTSLPSAALSAEPSLSVTLGREGRDPTVEPRGDRAALGTGTARSLGQQGRSGGQHAQGCSEETWPRHGRGMALLEAGRRALRRVTASCTSCWSFYSGPPSGWGSCFPPWILRSLPWWRLGLYLVAAWASCAARASGAGSWCSRQGP